MLSPTRKDGQEETAAPRAAEQAARGEAMMRAGDHQGASRVFGELLEATGGAPWAHNLLGVSLMLGNRASEAGRHFQLAVEKNPQDALFRTNLGKFMVTQRRWDEGAHHLLAALEASPHKVDQETLRLLNLCREGLNLGPLDARHLSKGPVRPSAAGEADFPRPARPLPAASPAASSPAKRASAAARKMVLCCLPNMDNFVSDIISAFSPEIQIQKAVSTDLGQFQKALHGVDLVWLEWGNQLAQALTTQGAAWLKGKRVLLRIHSYEVLDGLADAIDYSLVDDLIFVAPHIRDILLARKPEIKKQVKRIHVIPNGVDLARFRLVKRQPGFNIAYLGSINFKKDPMVLLQAFQALHARDSRYLLHVGGGVEQARYHFAMANFEEQNNLAGAVRRYGRINDVPAWLEPMNYIICSSLMEGHPVGLLEAMATGCQPLIYAWPGAEAFYPREFLWSNHEELWQLLGRVMDPAQVRAFVAENYSLEAQAASLKRVILDEDAVDFSGFKKPPLDPPPVPQACFSPSRQQRALANREFGRGLARQGFLKEAQVFLERSWLASACRDLEAGQALLELHERRGQWNDLGRVLKEEAFQAARRRDYDAMLEYFYGAYYLAYVRTRRYEYVRYDPAVDAVLDLVAREVTPLPPPAGALEGLDRDQTRVAIGLEGFDIKQAPPAMICELAKGLAAHGMEVIMFTRLELQAAWQPALAELAQAGCQVLRLPQVSQMEKLRMTLGAIREAGCKAVLMQTPWLVPWLNLLAMCRPAPYLIKIPNQQGGWETNLDYVILQNEPAVINEAQEAVNLGVPYQGSATAPQPLPGREIGQLRALIVGRAPKLQHPAFWKALALALAENPGLEISVAGAKAEELPAGLVPREARLRVLGFSNEVPRLMGEHDVVLDTWPSGGGSVIFEAVSLGRPVISCRTNWYKHRSGDENVYNHLVHPELLLEKFSPRPLSALFRRLAGEAGWLERLHQECLAIKLVDIPEYHGRLAGFIRDLPAEPRRADR